MLGSSSPCFLFSLQGRRLCSEGISAAIALKRFPSSSLSWRRLTLVIRFANPVRCQLLNPLAMVDAKYTKKNALLVEHIDGVFCRAIVFGGAAAGVIQRCVPCFARESRSHKHYFTMYFYLPYSHFLLLHSPFSIQK